MWFRVGDVGRVMDQAGGAGDGGAPARAGDGGAGMAADDDVVLVRYLRCAPR